VEEVVLLEKLCANLSQAASNLAQARQQAALERQLKQSEETYRTLFETVQQGVVFQGASGEIVSANPAAERILGISLAQMQGRTSMDPRWGTIHPDGSPFPGTEHPSMQALATGQPIKGVVMGVVNPLVAATIWISVNSTPILDKDTGAVDYVYAIFDDISETVRLQQELQAQAHRDFLTEIANRRYFFHLGARELARAERYGGDVSLIMLDIDHFKMVNDTHGHAAGDIVLKAVAQICKTGLREIDILGRIGGEEFAILLPQTSGDTAREVAERIRNAVQDAAVPAGNGLPAIQVTVSMGVSTEKAVHVSLDDLLQEADTALYKAKHTGRNRVCCAF
jgi:diguanylate cyclase (GGDEF)-like protein